MYATTKQFLDYFNLKGLDDLPPLAEIRDIDKINEELDLQMPGFEGKVAAVVGTKISYREPLGNEDGSILLYDITVPYRPTWYHE